MTVRIAVLGDIVGAPGRLALAQQIDALHERWSVDLILANAENCANGSGLTPQLYRKLCDAGVDGMTLGDHVYKKKQIVSVLEQQANIIRPANLSGQAIGQGHMKLTTKSGIDVHIITLLGRLFMPIPANDPFDCVHQILAKLPKTGAIVLVEIHAEASSEKVALGWFLNGRATCVFGTHTHVATADARILPAPGSDPTLPQMGSRTGTAYITDIGMTGAMDSVLGRRADRVVAQMTTSIPTPFDVAEINPRVNGIVLKADAESGRAISIERIELAADPTKPPFVA